MMVELENAALSTSGDYEKFFTINGRRYHHISFVSIAVDGREKMRDARRHPEHRRLHYD